MRRITLILPLLGLAAASWACSTDSASPTGPGPTPVAGPSPVQVALSTTNASPAAKTCTPIQALLTLNGVNVNGTLVTFRTTLGTFQENASTSISVATQNGVAATSLCSDVAGPAVVNASATVGSSFGSATLTVTFQ